MNLVGSADEQVLSGPRCRDLRDGLLASFGCSSLTLHFS